MQTFFICLAGFLLMLAGAICVGKIFHFCRQGDDPVTKYGWEHECETPPPELIEQILAKNNGGIISKK